MHPVLIRGCKIIHLEINHHVGSCLLLTPLSLFSLGGLFYFCLYNGRVFTTIQGYRYDKKAKFTFSLLEVETDPRRAHCRAGRARWAIDKAAGTSAQGWVEGGGGWVGGG